MVCIGEFPFLAVTLKVKRPSGRAPPLKASDSLVRHRLCRMWARSYAYPGSISEPPAEGSSIAQSAVGVKGLGQTPLFIADRSSNS